MTNPKRKEELVLVYVYCLTVLDNFVIGSFRCPDTERLVAKAFARFRSIERQALRKLDMLDAAPDLRTWG